MTTMTDTERTCAARIAAQQAGREDYLRRLYAVTDGQAETDGDGLADVDGEMLSEDDATERLDELPLGVSLVYTLRIDLSTGGPADYLTADLDGPGGAVQSLTYHFADWFDHAEQPVPEDSPLWRFAEQYAEIVGNV